MDINSTPNSFEVLISEKRDMEKETEFMLPEYLPNMQTPVKAEARIKLLDKNTGENGVTVSGEVVYTVLYASDHNGALKCAVFSDDFTVSFDWPEGAEVPKNLEIPRDYLHVLTHACVNSVSVRMANQRRLTARARFTLLCEVLFTGEKEKTNQQTGEKESCDIQYLEKNACAGKIYLSEEYHHSLSEEIRLESDMPEISDIILADASCCVKEVAPGEGTAEVTGELAFTCLYETRHEEASEYISLTKEIPFRFDMDFADADNGKKLMAEVTLTSLSVESVSDNYGEQKILSVSAELVVRLFAFCNETVKICTDLYSTECSVMPQRQSVRLYSFEDVYTGTLFAEEKLRTELRGMTELVNSTLKLSFMNPEFVEGRAFIPARGTLSLLGLKENGEVEAVQTQVILKIAAPNMPSSLSGKKIKWFNSTGLCSHACEISGGEILLKVWLNQSCAAFHDESFDIVCGFEEAPERKDEAKRSGFTLYYPEPGESVWNVAKSHFVSCEKVKAENGVTGEVFDGKKTVILH